MQERGIEQMFVTDPDSIWYLTGISNEPYERMYGFLIRTNGEHKLFLNRLFVIPETPWEKVWYSDTDNSVDFLAEEIDKEKPLGIDKEWTARFLIPLIQKCPNATPILASDILDTCRAVKDEEECGLMREASGINDMVIHKAMKSIHRGVTELEVKEYIENEYKLAGCEGTSFSTIVSFGAHASDPHHEPDSTKLNPGDCVLIDMGCKKNRYCSDMTRTAYYQSVSEEEKKIYNLVLQANEKAESIVRPGVTLRDVDTAARAIIEAEGYGEGFNHRLGHFIGQKDHEMGDVSQTSAIVAEPGMIFSIEPGIYIPGKYGVRIEDLVLVTEDGCEVLNHESKEMNIITD